MTGEGTVRGTRGPAHSPGLPARGPGVLGYDRRVMCSTGRGIDTSGRRRLARELAVGLVAVLCLAACGNSQSPTDPARLAEAHRAEADLAVKTPDVVDALFLGSGPLIPRDGSVDCPLQGFWSGYPRGASVRLRVSSRVPGPAQAGIAGTVGALAGATAGSLLVNMEVTPETDPQPGVNEVTVAEAALPRVAGCASDAGCVQYRFAGRGLLMSARIIEPRAQSTAAYVHDTVGHGVLGLCHIDARLIGGGENSLMSSGPPGSGASTFTGLDLEAIRTVYASGVNPGAARSTFLAARLVNLQAGQLPRVP